MSRRFTIQEQRRANRIAPIPTTAEKHALDKVICGHKARKYGLTYVCRYPVAHLGPHQGAMA
jgi:hypothetical protein